ncbi:MAG: cytochrome P450 [Acidimicrobiales bacterium]
MIDLESPASIRRPAEYFDTVRGDGPVQWSDAHHAWLVIDHAEVAAAFRDASTLSADRVGPLERVADQRPEAFQRVVELLRGWMVFHDPPRHTELRHPVRSAFSPRRVDGLSGLVAGVVDDVVGRLPDRGEIEVRRDFAAPLPAQVIAAVLGVDGDDRHRFQAWSDDLATVVFATTPSSVPTDQAVRAAATFAEFWQGHIARERRDPSGTMLTALVDGAGDRLTPLELVGACTLLLFAGHETTTSLLSNAMGLFMERPELLAQLRAHPEADAAAVEELLRVLGPTRTMFRKAVTDHERGGRPIRAGQTVGLAMCAANHDPAVFDRPGEVDLARDPNPHLTFGWGLHHCLGAHLARLEARLALRALLDRYDRIEPAGPVPPITGTVLGYAREPVRVRVS